MATRPPPTKRPLKVFLSHGYGAQAINLRFYEVFSQAAQLQFSVDIGKLPTSVTRLERLVREADAFIGVYSLAGDPGAVVSRQQLVEQSRYFRLELDIAVRSGVPAIVFADGRFGSVLACPAPVQRHSFDAQELHGAQQGAKWGTGLQTHAKSFKAFCAAALAYQSYRVQRLAAQRERSQVLLLLPTDTYPPALRQRLAGVLQNAPGLPREVLDLPWPPRLTRGFYDALASADWAVVDVGDRADGASITGFLQGAFVPLVRLHHGAGTAAPPATATRDALYGDLEAGYPKDVVAWSDEAALVDALQDRVKAIASPHRLIDSTAQAVDYFATAAGRKEMVFVSYAGADAAAAQPIIQALKAVFRTVFDYKDGESITAGKPWLDEIFDKLSRSAVGVMLLSKPYFASGNCKREAESIVALHDDHKMAMLPLRLYDEPLETPSWLTQVQHGRMVQLPGPEAVPGMVLKLLADANPG